MSGLVWEPEWPGASYQAHLDEVPWFDAPLPRRWHRCAIQTRSLVGEIVDRCACGAIRWNRRWWHDRNLRRRLDGRSEAAAARRGRERKRRHLDLLVAENDFVARWLSRRPA